MGLVCTGTTARVERGALQVQDQAISEAAWPRAAPQGCDCGAQKQPKLTIFVCEGRAKAPILIRPKQAKTFEIEYSHPPGALKNIPFLFAWGRRKSPKLTIFVCRRRATNPCFVRSGQAGTTDIDHFCPSRGGKRPLLSN